MEPPLRSSLALRGVALLQGLPAARLDALAQQCHWQQLAAHQPLMRRAEPPREVVFLLAGRVRVTIYAASGRQVSFRDAAAGECFGDLAAIDGQPRSADVVTLAPSLVASLGCADFLALLREEAVVAEVELRRLAGLVRQLSERVIELSTLDVPQRLHAELLRQAHVAGVTDNRARLDPAPRHEALANQISSGREQVTRELGAMARDGLLVREDRTLLLLDVERLADMVAQAAR